jgi:N-glycosylase/DNA lyase
MPYLPCLGFVHRELASFTRLPRFPSSALLRTHWDFGVESSCSVPKSTVGVLSIAEVHDRMTHGRAFQKMSGSAASRRLPPRSLRTKREYSTYSPVRSRAAPDSIELLSSPCSTSSIAGYTSKSVEVDDSAWVSMLVEDGYLRLDLTLFGGQCFRWRDLGLVSWRGEEYREYAGVVNRAIVVLRQRKDEEPGLTPEQIWYRIENGYEEPEEQCAALRKFFRADVDLRPIIDHFANRDARFRVIFPHFRGARMLRQDPVESLFAFICSSNNNVKRITGMVNCLAERYGDPIGSYKAISFYAFPTVDTLAACANEEDLRSAGFGYRAKYIVKSAAKLRDLGGESYLLSLLTKPREDVARALVALDGIGRKVAGCIALTSLDCSDEIPCDTHVWQIAKRDYLPSLRSKTLTDRVYTQIGDHFRTLFGEYAGWAHNYLFIAELSEFKDRLPPVSKREDGAFNEPTLKLSEITVEVVVAKSEATTGKRKRSKVKTRVGLDG